MDLNQLLEWDKAGPVAILMVVVVGLAYLARWLLREVLREKDRQITRLETLNDRATVEIGATLKQILDSLRDEARR